MSLGFQQGPRSADFDASSVVHMPPGAETPGSPSGEAEVALLFCRSFASTWEPREGAIDEEREAGFRHRAEARAGSQARVPVREANFTPAQTGWKRNCRGRESTTGRPDRAGSRVLGLTRVTESQAVPARASLLLSRAAADGQKGFRLASASLSSGLSGQVSYGGHHRPGGL